jgi:hypothetical protein
MSKPLYVCTICSEDFTRKSDGDRHNKNYHSKKGEIIGFIDYMIGRVKNAIPPPIELTPRLAAARRRKKVFSRSKNDRGFTVYPDTTTGAHVFNNECYPDQSIVPSTEKSDSATKFSNLQKTQDKSLLDESIDYAKRLTELQRLLRDLSYTGSTSSSNFIGSPPVSLTQPNHDLSPANSTPSYFFDIEKHMPNRKDIFGFSAQSCNQCLSFEIVPHYFAAPVQDRFTRSTHKCKESLAQSSTTKRQDIDIHSLVRDNCERMLLATYILTQIWTDNNPYLRVVPLYNHLREKHKVLQIRYPSNPDKLIRVPLKFDEVIELGAQRENHWASRVIKEEVTPIESHELMEFLMIQISTYGIFRVKSLSESQPRGVSLDLYFMYVSRYSPDKFPSVVLVLQT